MKPETKSAIIEFTISLVIIGLYDGLIALCNHWLRLNGWNTKVFLPLLLMSVIYVNYKLWRRLCRRLNNNSKS